jgi:hypothetical protein
MSWEGFTMRHRILLLVTVLGLLLAQPAQAQPIKSPAELFPAKTLGYAEIQQPGQLAKEIGSLFQGSVLGNVPDSLDKLRAKYDKGGWFRVGQEIGPFGLMLSSEVIQEVSRLKGAAVGITGFGKHGEPEYVAVVLPGGSLAPSFFMRTFLTMERVRVIGKVEGVSIYRAYSRAASKKEPGGPVQFEMHEYGPAVARMPGVLFLGSPDAVKEAIRRAKGKAEGDSLAKVEAFQTARKEAYQEPGLFAYADIPHLMDAIEGVVKQKGNAAAYNAVMKLMNPKAFRSWFASLTLILQRPR